MIQSLKDLRRGWGSLRELSEAQERHQELFSLAYPGHSRPKHHLRLHLSSCLQSFYVDCWPTEARHRAYKGQLADALQGQLGQGGGVFSHQVLSRMLHRTVELQSGNWRPQLAGQTYQAEQVAELAGFHASVSTKFVHGSLELEKDQIAFWDGGKAGWTHFFAEEAGQFVVLLERLQEAPADKPNVRRFARSRQKEFWRLDGLHRLHQPTWWYEEHGFILVLP